MPHRGTRSVELCSRFSLKLASAPPMHFLDRTGYIFYATFLLWKIPPNWKTIVNIAMVCIAVLLVFYNLKLALVGGAPMPDSLVESGVAHGVGFGIGLIYGALIFKSPTFEPSPST